MRKKKLQILIFGTTQKEAEILMKSLRFKKKWVEDFNTFENGW